jgi:LIM domain
LHTDRPFFRPSELTPASSDTISPTGGLSSRKSPFHLWQRSPPLGIPQVPPSPEYTNLDCAFPPFPITTARSATPVSESRVPDPHFDNVYVREHAEPYNQSRPVSPSFSQQHSRSRSVASSRSRNRSGTIGSRADPIPRPSTSNGTRKPSLASISGGPKPARGERPPLPHTPSMHAPFLPAPQAQRAGFLGPEPVSSRGGSLNGQASQRQPLSPSRSQTFPLHNEDRISGNGSNSFMNRRPSQPSPKPTRGGPSRGSDISSLRSVQVPGSTYQTYNPPTGTFTSQPQPNTFAPPSTSRNISGAISGNRPFPVRSASRGDICFPFPDPSQPALPAPAISGDSIHTNQFHTSFDPATSNASIGSVAESGSLRANPPTANTTLRNEPSDRRNERDAASLPIPGLAMPPESPTDPFCLAGRLSPIPHASMDESPLSIDASSSSRASSSRNPSSTEASSRRVTAGGSRGICRGCAQPIMTGQKSISSKDGRLTGRYHKQCFACHTCHARFETADFYVHDDHPFCAEHYHALNGTLCTGCGQGIEGQYLEAMSSNGMEVVKFHPQCLKCSSCRLSLQNDYFEWMGKVYCERDAKRAAGVPMQSPNEAFIPPRLSPSSSSYLPSTTSPLARAGLPAGPRAGLRPPGPGSGNGFLSPSPLNGGTQAPSSGGRFPERRTTRLMMI